MATYKPKFHVPNPLDYVDGKALGKYLRSNPTPAAKKRRVKSVQLPQRVNRGEGYY